MPEIRDVPAMPVLFLEYLDLLAPKVAFPLAVQEVLGVFESKEARLQKTREAFECYPQHIDKFMEFVRISREIEKAEAKTLEQVLTLYGLDNARNLLLCFELFQNVFERSFPWDSRTSRMTLDPGRQISYANKSYEEVGEGNRFANGVFTAGLIYDILRMYAEHKLKDVKRPVVEFIERTFHHSLRSARVLLSLTKRMKTLDLAEYALASALLHDIGKVVLAVLDVRYVDFAMGFELNRIPRTLCVHAEEQKYGVSHPVFGYMICEAFPMLQPVAKAILHHHDPYVLKHREQLSLYQIAGTVSLATNITRTNLKLPVDAIAEVKARSKFITDQDRVKATKMTEESVRNLWMGPELEDHDLSPLEIHEIIRSMFADLIS